MRPVLALAVMLLALTAALESAERLRPDPEPGTGLADRALELVIGAKGPMLPAARLGSGPERLGEAMRIGARTLVADGSSGLRAAFIGPDLSFRGEARYDVAGSEGDCAALARVVARADEGEVLVLASSGKLARPGGAAPHADLERALALLGARARPGRVTPESWALIALRGARGWVPLAEGYGTDSGVALAYVLGPELARRAERTCDLVHARASAQSEVELLDELAQASERTPGVALAREGAVRGQPLASLSMPARPPAGAGGARIAWDDVAIGPGSCVGALIGLDDSVGTGRARFQVWFDGELVGERTVEAGASWRQALFDLRPFAGRRGRLALALEPAGDGPGTVGLWGRPQLFHGYERSPFEVRAQER